jgi:hypothetical protein
LKVSKPSLLDESGSALLEFVVIMPLSVVLLVSWTTELHLIQVHKFALTSIAAELRRGVETGHSPRELTLRVSALANELGLRGNVRVEASNDDENSLVLQLSLADIEITERANLSNADPTWRRLTPDRGSMLPIFAAALGVMFAASFMVANASAALIADERAHAIASNLAIELANAPDSEFAPRVKTYIEQTNQQFEWSATRTDSRTVEVRVCSVYESPITMLGSTGAQKACESRQARLISTASG